ncbi:MAG: two-component system, OmpR family, osmolarity sensor histidine kinase EnvZ [Rhodobacteraceae bacterium HLUCCA08]|nr:MAG: two-component system, OmpR family, osmolarity sensor histidine kinase EnvZ [Rhodobacteraceae bacterium HLUCCA08]
MSFRWLKRFMPRGLYGRAALILLLPVITLQLAISVVFVQRHFEDVTEQMTRSILYDLVYLVDAVNAAPDLAAAQETAAGIAGPLALDARLPVTEVPAGDLRRWYDFSGIVVLRVLHEGLPTLGPVHLPDIRRMTLWFETEHGVMRVGLDRGRVSASNPHQLLVWMVVLGFLMTFIAYLYLRNQLRPIKRLAGAAAEYGRGRIVPYHPSGAVEVRAAGHAFVDMRNRIERQTQARTMMLSGVSHDLRTPLTRLRLGLGLMDEDEAAPMIRDVDEMERLLDAFLDFARGDAEDDFETVDPIALVREVIADAHRSGQAVSAGAMEAGGAVSLRPMAVKRALQNLLGNALRYGSQARIGVVMGARSVRFTVEDDGPGIPAEARDEAIRPFVRLDPARNQDRGTGVGLGLSIVSDIARSHGGMLRLGDSADLGGLQADLVLAR